MSWSRFGFGNQTLLRFAGAIALTCVLASCTPSPASEQAVMSPRVVGCQDAALGIQARVDEARQILEQRAPVMADELQKVVDLIKSKDRVRADAAYRDLKTDLVEIEGASAELLERFDATVVDCDASASAPCWSDVTAAYQAAGGDAIAILQKNLVETLAHVKRFFSLDKESTKKQTRSSYLGLRAALRDLRAGAMAFAHAHNEAVEEFNDCASA